jgi:hypothetical protein
MNKGEVMENFQSGGRHDGVIYLVVKQITGHK